MATKGTELDVVGSGIHNASIAYPTKNSYVQNMIFNNEWETRSGFGLLGEWDSTLSRLNETTDVFSDFNGYKTHLGSHVMETNFGHRQIISIFFLNAYVSQGINERDLTSTPQPVNNIIENTQQQVPTFAISIYDITTNTRWEEILHKMTADIVPLSENRPYSNLLQLGGDMPYQHGYYASNRDRPYQSVTISFDKNPSDNVNFTEINDILYFGSKDIGQYYYKPAAFIGNRSKAIDFLRSKADCKGYSESSLIYSLKLTPGRFSARYEYLTSVGAINGLSRLGTRLIYIGERRLFFSDSDRTSSVVAGHALDIPSEYPITGVQEINGNLLIWTRSETFLYQPQSSFFVNNGVTTKISESIGCLSHSSHMKFENTVIWVSDIGVHSNSGGLKVDTISDNIRAFFENFLSNPVSHFHLNGPLSPGVTALALGEQPKCQYSLNPKGITLAYSPRFGSVFINIPEERCTLVLNNNAEWSIWTYDSITKWAPYGAAEVPVNFIGVHQFMDCQQILTMDQDIYCVGLDEREANKITDDSIEIWDPAAAPATPGAMVPDTPRDQRFKSYFICEYGRGGGCDRNIDNEDYRYGIGEWTEMDLTAAVPIAQGVDRSYSLNHWFDFIIGKPQIQPPGFVIDGVAIENKCALVPIQIRVPAELSGIVAQGTDALTEGSASPKWYANTITNLSLTFQFDRRNWKPSPAAPFVLVEDLNPIMKTPMENLGSGWGGADPGFTMGNQKQIRLYNITSGLPSGNGNQIRINWNMNDAGFDTAAGAVKAPMNMQHFILPSPCFLPGGFTAPLTDHYCPIPASHDQLTTLFWIPFERRNGTDAVSSINIKNMQGLMYTNIQNNNAPVAGSFYYRSRNFKWEASEIRNSTSAHKEDNVAQSVDWAYLSPPIGIDGADQSKARGLYANISSRGLSNDPIENSWAPHYAPTPLIHQPQYRLFNTVVAADGTAWQGQIVDHASINSVQLSGVPFDPTVTSDPTAIRESYNQIWEPPTKGQTGIRTRVRDSAGVMQYKVFGDPACKWGDDSGFGPLTPDGTVLVDDPQYGVISESNSTRGQWFNWMFFGHVLDKAEKLILSSAKAVIRKVSGRRRTGHTRSKIPE